MTKKNYILISKVIRNYLEAEQSGSAYDLVAGIADILSQDNPKFNKEKFFKACEPIKMCKICEQPEDDDGRCSCTNKDSN